MFMPTKKRLNELFRYSNEKGVLKDTGETHSKYNDKVQFDLNSVPPSSNFNDNNTNTNDKNVMDSNSSSSSLHDFGEEELSLKDSFISKQL